MDTLSPEAPVETVAPEPVRSRRPATDLESDLKVILDSIVLGNITIDGAPTPHTLARLIHENRKVTEGEDAVKPSSGAVTAALQRWERIGYVTLKTGPLAFDDYTEDARTLGLAALKQRHRQALSDQRKATATAAEPTPAPSEPAPSEPPF